MAKGIRSTKYGRQGFFRYLGQFHQRHFPPGTKDAVIAGWIAHERERLAAVTPGAPPSNQPSPSGLATDMDEYLKTVPALTRITKRYELLAWVRAFGPNRLRETITSLEVRQTIVAWQDKGFSPTTINHRRRALSQLFRVMGGEDPTTGIQMLPEPGARKRALSFVDIKRIFREIGPSKSKARLQVMAYAGLPQATLMRLRPEHVNWVDHSIVRPGRKKGKGTPDDVMVMSRRGMAALRVLRAMNAWGKFANVGVRTVFARGLAKALVKYPDMKLPDDPTPYDLRHSFASALYERSGNLQATAGILGHASTKTTLRYVQQAIKSVELEAMRQAEREFSGRTPGENRGRKLQESCNNEGLS